MQTPILLRKNALHRRKRPDKTVGKRQNQACCKRWRASGIGSACPYYPESYQSNETDTYYGEALAIIRPQAGAGKVVVKAESKLGNAETEIEILD